MPVNSTPAQKADNPRDASAAGADERLANAYKQIVSADEQLARLSEQVSRMERNAGRADSAGIGLRSAAGRRPLAVMGLALSACAIVATLVWQWSLGGADGPVADPAPTLALATSLPPENPPLPVEPAPPAVQLAAAEAAPAQATPEVQAAPPATPVAEAAPQAAGTPQVAAAAVAETAPQATVVAQAAQQDAAPAPVGPTLPTAAAASPDNAKLLETMARDLANLQRSIEQLKAAQQQTAGDNAKEIAAIKASQEELKRSLAKASEQGAPKASAPPTASPSAAASPPPTASPPPAASPPRAASPPPARAAKPAPVLRKPERTVERPRPRPRYPRRWYYDDDYW